MDEYEPIDKIDFLGVWIDDWLGSAYSSKVSNQICSMKQTFETFIENAWDSL